MSGVLSTCRLKNWQSECQFLNDGVHLAQIFHSSFEMAKTVQPQPPFPPTAPFQAVPQPEQSVGPASTAHVQANVLPFNRIKVQTVKGYPIHIYQQALLVRPGVSVEVYADPWVLAQIAAGVLQEV